MRNILVIVGSGTKRGNTSRLVDAFCEGAIKVGHQVHKVFLGDKKLSGCKSDLKNKIIDEKFLQQAYELGANI